MIGKIIAYITLHLKKNHELYTTIPYNLDYQTPGIIALFINEKDAQAVINNPNFREILDTIYKD